MAEQVNPTGSLVSGLALALPAIPVPKPTAPAGPPAGASPSTPPVTEAEREPAVHRTVSPEAAVSQINAHLQQAATELRIQVDKATGRTVYKVVDEHSGQTVLQIPSEELLALARNLRALDAKLGVPSAGLLVDKEG